MGCCSRLNASTYLLEYPQQGESDDGPALSDLQL